MLFVLMAVYGMVFVTPAAALAGNGVGGVG